MERYCVYQERCHAEVERKLHEFRLIPLAKEEILLHLMQHDFLNEQRFAMAFARGKFSIKKYGRVRISLELKKRKISAYNIKAGLAEIDAEQYHQTLHELAVKKNGELAESNPYKKRKKIADFLLRKGYESHLVFEKLQELISV